MKDKPVLLHPNMSAPLAPPACSRESPKMYD
jgi:hypothetical protein